MAEVLSPIQSTSSTIPETLKLTAETRLPLPSRTVAIPQPDAAQRQSQLDVATLSPVNQKGHYEFDRVLKNGVVYKRTRKTKQWRSFYLVLRPNLLSIYKSPSEERLLKQVNLSDLSAVAYLKDPKGKRENVFGLFSPSRNFHFQTNSPEETRSWVELIKREARIDREEQGTLYHSPTAHEAHPDRPWEHDRHGSSSPEPFETHPRTSTTRDGIRIPSAGKPSAHDLDYSGNEQGSYSDFSDATPAQSNNQNTFGSLITPKARNASPYNPHFTNASTSRPSVLRTASQHSIPPSASPTDPERVLWHGYLLCLKSHRGVRQWKRLWAVLRARNLALYKNEEEYSAQLILPLSNIISAVEIDPVSRSKKHCMQIIAEDRSYRFCASSEEGLARWLGALKCLLVKRMEREGAGRTMI